MDIRGNIEPKKITTRMNNYVLPVATENKLGGVKIGDNLEIESDGTLNAVGGGSIEELELDEYEATLYSDLDVGVTYRVSVSGYIANDDDEWMLFEVGSILCNCEYGFWGLNGEGIFTCYHGGQPLFTGSWWDFLVLTSAEVAVYYQEKLVSGQNIKTINSQSLLGNGNIQLDATTITKLTSATISLELEDNHIYTAQNTLPNSITITSASGLNADNMGVCELIFMTSAVAPSFNYPSDISFEGDDVVDSEFVPEPNHIYDILFAHNGFVVLGTVKGVDLDA